MQTSVGREDGTISGTALTADPLLRPLASNGGFTQTMLPGAGSPALDAGSAFGLTTDQRGLAGPPICPRSQLQRRRRYRRRRGAGPGPPAGPPALPSAPQAFGAKTLVTIRAADRIRRRSRLPVVVRNRNKFAVTGRLSGRRRSAKIRSRPLNIAAKGRATAQTASPASHTPDTDPTRTGDPTPHRDRTGPGLQSSQGHTARHGEAESTGPPLTHC